MRQAVTAALIASSLAGVSAQRDAACDTCEPVRSGSVILIRHPVFLATSLEELVPKAELIVAGVVGQAQTTRLRNPQDPASVHTDSSFSLKRVLKGAAPERIIVTQPGGRYGWMDIDASQDPLMRPGETYILFLQRDDSPQPADGSDALRFTLTGAWSGKFKVSQGRIEPNRNTAPGILAYRSEEAEVFMARIMTLHRRDAESRKRRSK